MILKIMPAKIMALSTKVCAEQIGGQAQEHLNVNIKLTIIETMWGMVCK